MSLDKIIILRYLDFVIQGYGIDPHDSGSQPTKGTLMLEDAKLSIYICLAILLTLIPSAMGLLMVHFHSPYVGFRDIKASHDKIQIGMNQSEVWMILGQPDRLHHRYDHQDENWHYVIDGLSGSFDVYFDRTTGFVKSTSYF